jgi:hypothetical protein
MSTRRIKALLKSLEELDGVSVEVSGSTNGRLHIRHSREHGLNFVFKCGDPHHFVGYFVDAESNRSQAIVSLHNPMDAIQFVAAYTMLDAIRARQRKA